MMIEVSIMQMVSFICRVQATNIWKLRYAQFGLFRYTRLMMEVEGLWVSLHNYYYSVLGVFATTCQGTL